MPPLQSRTPAPLSVSDVTAWHISGSLPRMAKRNSYFEEDDEDETDDLDDDCPGDDEQEDRDDDDEEEPAQVSHEGLVIPPC